MNWTDFFFGAVAGVSFVLLVAGIFLYRIMRPYIQAAAVAAKAQAERRKSGGGRAPSWPTSFGTSNSPTDGNP